MCCSILVAAAAASTEPAAEASRKLLDSQWNGRYFEVSEEALDLLRSIPGEAQVGWLVQFYTPWCGRCREFGAEWGKLAESTDQRSPDASLRLATLDAFDSTAVIRRFGIRSFPEFLLLNGSEFHRFRGELSLPRLQAFASSGGGDGTPETIRHASEDFALKKFRADIPAEKQEQTELGAASRATLPPACPRASRRSRWTPSHSLRPQASRWRSPSS